MNNNAVSSKVLYALVFVSGVTWGLAFLVTKNLVEELNPIQLQATRWFCAAAFLLTVCLIKGIRLDFRKKSLKYLLIGGLFEPCGYYIFETYGLQLTSASIGAIFVATVPCFVMIINRIVTGRKTSSLGKFCIILAFSGVAVCTFFSPDFSVSGNMTGYICMLVAVISASIYTVVAAKAGEEYSALEVTTITAVYGCVFFNILNFTIGTGFETYAVVLSSSRLLLQVAFLGIVSSAICYIAYNKIITMMNPALADNLCSSIVTVTGTAAGIFIAGDAGGLYTVIGLAMTLTGVILTSKEI